MIVSVMHLSLHRANYQAITRHYHIIHPTCISNAFVFDTHHSFHYYDNDHIFAQDEDGERACFRKSKYHTFDSKENRSSYDISGFGRGKYNISFRHHWKFNTGAWQGMMGMPVGYTTMIYSPKSDFLIDDLDAIMGGPKINPVSRITVGEVGPTISE